jgi:hypothetical protein
MVERVGSVPHAVWRALAAAFLLAGAVVPCLSTPPLSITALLSRLLVLCLVSTIAYWFVRLALGPFLGFLASPSHVVPLMALLVVLHAVAGVGSTVGIAGSEPSADVVWLAACSGGLLAFSALLRQFRSAFEDPGA